MASARIEPTTAKSLLSSTDHTCTLSRDGYGALVSFRRAPASCREQGIDKPSYRPRPFEAKRRLLFRMPYPGTNGFQNPYDFLTEEINVPRERGGFPPFPRGILGPWPVMSPATIAALYRAQKTCLSSLPALSTPGWPTSLSLPTHHQTLYPRLLLCFACLDRRTMRPRHTV